MFRVVWVPFHQFDGVIISRVQNAKRVYFIALRVVCGGLGRGYNLYTKPFIQELCRLPEKCVREKAMHKINEGDALG